MQQNLMNKNRKEKSMCKRTTPMNLNQRTNEKIRKTHRSIYDKSIQKCTSLGRNSVQMRDGPNRMVRNLEKQIMNLGQLVRGDPRIRTPLDRRSSKIWHNVIKWRRLIIRIGEMLDLRHPKSRGHYRRSNDILFTPYPTLHKLSVGIIGVDREVRIKLFDQLSQRRMVYIQQRQPALTLKVSPNLRVKLI